MSTLMELLYDYAFDYRLSRYLEQSDYNEAKTLEARHLAALRDGLSEERAASLDHLLDAQEDLRSLELRALFLTAFSVARELYAG